MVPGKWKYYRCRNLKPDQVDPKLQLAVCVPYKVNCHHMFTIKHVALPKWTICLIKTIKSVYNLCKGSLPNWTVRVGVRQSARCEMIFKRIFYQAGSETWRYLLGGETISDLQQVRDGHSSNCCCTAVLISGKLERDIYVMFLSILPQVSSAHKAIQVREPYERLLSAYRCLVLSNLFW